MDKKHCYNQDKVNNVVTAPLIKIIVVVGVRTLFGFLRFVVPQDMCGHISKKYQYCNSDFVHHIDYAT